MAEPASRRRDRNDPAPMTGVRRLRCAALTAALLAPATASAEVAAAPPRALAKKCLSIAYKSFPWARPGSAPMSDGRYRLFRDCIAHNGDIEPPPFPAPRKPLDPP